MTSADVLSAHEIRRRFLDFFAERAHTIVPSAPIVLKNDPTLMFTNAGMNQFKDIFLGVANTTYQRAADTQKCLRVSGKHNDLDEVGHDTYHHTMFEMLGNWSFGDYFKTDAIAWAWELLTQVYNIAPDRLYASVFSGDEKAGLAADKEAAEAWKKYLPETRILYCSAKDNFWEMGETGPCGPCSEIHIDCRSDEERAQLDGAKLVNEGHDQVIEIWNLVFIAFNRKKDGTLEPLAHKHVDTGMGLERLVRVLQNKNSNYDTDLFSGIMDEVAQHTGKHYTGGTGITDVAFRVIADHVRAVAFCIADGQSPDSNGAGYVVRRILRRAIRYYYSHLARQEPLIYLLVPTLCAQYGDMFPELRAQEKTIIKIIRSEEEQFLRTIAQGIKRLHAYFNTSENTKNIDGALAFELYDTYGFPLDVTRQIAHEKGYAVDEKGFDKAMNEQKKRARDAGSIDAHDWQIIDEKSGGNVFVGYDKNENHTHVTRYRKVIKQGKTLYHIVLAETPFYAESGGQAGDTGVLIFGEGEKIPVLDTQKENSLIIHICEHLPQKINAPVRAVIDENKRAAHRQHHSATHLLHAVLREQIGKHVEQRGSSITQHALRFDFSHGDKIPDNTLANIEEKINFYIQKKLPVRSEIMKKEKAIALGAQALFGEKYGDEVRVITMSEGDNNPVVSRELCGGTHVGNTAEIGAVRLTAESAVGAGVRRIEAICGARAQAFDNENRKNIQQLQALLQNKNVVQSVEKLQVEKHKIEKKYARLEDALVQVQVDALKTKIQFLTRYALLIESITTTSVDALKKTAFALKSYLNVQKKDAPYLIVLLGKNGDENAYAVVLMDEKSVRDYGLNAQTILKTHIAKQMQGGGGGQANFASAGGRDTSKFSDILADLRAVLG